MELVLLESRAANFANQVDMVLLYWGRACPRVFVWLVTGASFHLMLAHLVIWIHAHSVLLVIFRSIEGKLGAMSAKVGVSPLHQVQVCVHSAQMENTAKTEVSAKYVRRGTPQN